MPYDVTTITLPSGARTTRLDGRGTITREDADYIMGLIAPGQPNADLPLLVLTQRMEKMSPEARSIFSAYGDRSWCAAVVSSPVLRVTVNFIMRIAQTKKVKVFSTEEDAIRWLDERASAG